METRDYELIFIMPPTLAEDEISEVEETVTGWISSHEGEITKNSHWGRRRLAYPIQNYKEGYYILFEMKTNPDSIKDIERRIRLYDPIIRHLVVRIDH
ncbi:MAG: 30S ribosomal protein S6 [Anaerolineales bacterium]